MELFKNTNYDFLGKKWPFIIASLILTVAGFASMAIKGLNYGIDFKGGALMTVKFAEAPPLDRIRDAFLHSQQTKGEVSVQNITDASTKNEVEIGIGTEQQTDAQLNSTAPPCSRCWRPRSASPRTASSISTTPGRMLWLRA